jgi:Transposase DDE domain group 1
VPSISAVPVDRDRWRRNNAGTGSDIGSAELCADVRHHAHNIVDLELLGEHGQHPVGDRVVAAARLRGGNAGSARGEASLATEAINTAREAGCTGLIMVRADSAFYGGAFVAACRRAGAQFSVIARLDPAIKASIAAIADDAWHGINYPNAIFDEDRGSWISDAEIAEVTYTAFASSTARRVTARLIVGGSNALTPSPKRLRLRSFCSRALWRSEVPIATLTAVAADRRWRVRT